MPVGLSFPTWARTGAANKSTLQATPKTTRKGRNILSPVELVMGRFLICGVNDRRIIFWMLVVQHPELEAEFLRSIAQEDLIDAGLVSGAEFEMNGPIRSNDQVLRSGDNLTAIQRLNGHRVTRVARRILNGDIDDLIMSQPDPIEPARAAIGCD
jgi:hypothetical protein